MLVGEAPFPGEYVEDVFDAVVNGNVVFPGNTTVYRSVIASLQAGFQRGEDASLRASFSRISRWPDHATPNLARFERQFPG